MGTGHWHRTQPIVGLWSGAGRQSISTYGCVSAAVSLDQMEAVRKSVVDPGLAEANDVGCTVAVHVAERARIPILAGPAAAQSEICAGIDRRGEMSVAGGESDVHSAAGEADDVGHPVAVHVAQQS